MTSSVDPSSGSCVSGTFDCVNGQLAQCVNSQFILTSCISGTICMKTSVGDGNIVAMCDYPPSMKLARNHAKRHDHRYRHFLIGPAHRG
jgi:hypothetical protein